MNNTIRIALNIISTAINAKNDKDTKLFLSLASAFILHQIGIDAGRIALLFEEETLQRFMVVLDYLKKRKGAGDGTYAV